MLDVIIVGAGFAGLSSALDLADAGLKICLLEAQDRVGGKVESALLSGGQRIDTGGQFFSRDMTNLMNLSQETGREVATTHYTGNTAYQPAISAEAGEAQWQGVSALRRRMAATALRDPELAGLSVADWVARQHDMPPEAKEGFLRMVKGLWCKDPAEVQFLYLADNDRRITGSHSEMEMFLPGTVHALAEEIAARLGTDLRLSTPIHRIIYEADRVSVEAEGLRLRAKRLVLALPPTIARRLEYSPPLPPSLQKALAAWSPGEAIKLRVTFDRPFWRDHGLSGEIMWSMPQGLYACDASDNRHAGLAVFIGGPEAKQWHRRSKGELKAFISSQLREILGTAATDIRDIHIRDWVDDRWSGGAYSDVIVMPDATDAEDILRRGHKPIYFASSELALSFPGYMEGAIVAGRKVAKDVLGDLPASDYHTRAAFR
ncbi:flavin monoamine oxidase family protein (plasmid) [Neorhizobium sp. SOG26]|uniref:flavin monoamine oxidase family protein n=1 Tax=Neorhizobium sp. SOG26 TaxID=2060726 RepID=UPI000E57A4F4|nr:FAD-dependent oxidoreductase [Neorhizobium sp. SOG26]AXV18340.1 flavin monoamine oxidase family protein [Neorhizobium sp. SOG26]